MLPVREREKDGMKKHWFLGVIACAVALHATRADAAFVGFDRLEYWVEPGNAVTVQVQFTVMPQEVASVAGVSAKVTISGGNVPGAVVTSMADVVQATTGTYILNGSTAFASFGSGSLVALGGDATLGNNEAKNPGTYSFMDITWNAGELADGDYFLTVEDVGLGINGLTFLADASGADSLTHAVGAVVHVPEPTSVALLGIGSLFVIRRKTRR